MFSSHGKLKLTEIEFAKTIILKKYPMKVALLAFNELIGAVLVVTGIGAVVPLLASLIDGKQEIPGKLGELLAYTGLQNANSASIMMFLIAVLAGRFLLDAVRGMIAGSIAVDLNRHLKSQINAKVASADWLYFINEDHGKYIQCMAVESATASGAVNDLAGVIANAVILSIMLIVMVFFSFYAFVITGIVAFILMLCAKIIMKKSHQAGIARIGMLNSLNNFILDNKNIMKLIKAEGLEAQRVSLAENLIGQVASSEKRQVAYALTVEGYNNIFILIVLGLLSYLYMGLGFGDGASLIFNLLLIQRAGSYFGIFQQKRRNMLQKIPSYKACLDIIEQAERAAVSRSGAINQISVREKLQIENVTFSYPDGTLALKDVNIELPAKGLIAFVGRSGSGKTTLIDIILGLLQPSEGKIRIDGYDINDIDPAAWRHMLTYVPQSAYLIQGTLRDNLSLGAPKVSDQDIWVALEKVGLMTLVKSLSHGLDIEVKAGGTNFSGGERQKLSMARALLRGSQILILDEPSASLDKKSEFEIKATINSLSGELLVIAVTHSLEFIEGLENVYLIKQGRSVWRGPAIDLKTNSHFTEMLKKS